MLSCVCRKVFSQFWSGNNRWNRQGGWKDTAITGHNKPKGGEEVLKEKLVGVAVFFFLVWSNLLSVAGAESSEPIRIGMIGLDTSHVISFTKIINAPQASGDLADMKIVVAYPGGSSTFPLSRDRVEGFTQQVRAMGIEIVDSIPALLKKCDVVMLESVDGSQHLEQVQLVFKARKRLFIDKPLAASLTDAIAISELGRRHDVPWFTSSSKRYVPVVASLTDKASLGEILGCDVYGTSQSVPNHPDLYWYGIHSGELLYRILGTGCVSVTAVQTPYTEQVTGTWQDGRVGTLRGIREKGGRQGFGATVFGTKRITSSAIGSDKSGLVREIARFFKTGKPPVPPEETLEIFAFLEAAEESKRQEGRPVAIAHVVKRSHAAALAKINEAQ